jgi:cobalamin synthase
VFVGTFVSLVLAIVTFGIIGMVLVVCAVLSALMIAAFAARRLGGLTGDVYGTAGVLTEVVLFLAAAALAQRDWLTSPWR